MARPFNPLMAAAFLPIADRYVGFPLLLDEAVSRALSIMFGDDWLLYMTLDEQLKWRDDYSTSLLFSLQTGEVGSFVEHSATGRWYRVPKQHWWPSDRMSVSLDLVEGVWPGRCPEMIGGPVIVWRDEIEAHFVKRKAELNKLATREPPAVAPPANVNQVVFRRETRPTVLDEWFLSRVRSAPAKGYTIKEDVEAGKAVGISREKIRLLRGLHAPQHWKKSGKKRN